jgi:hypothetical protein
MKQILSRWRKNPPRGLLVSVHNSAVERGALEKKVIVFPVLIRDVTNQTLGDGNN